MRIFTAWRQDGQANTLVMDEDIPRFADGTPQPECHELIWRIEACNWEEAMAIYHLRQGWNPYLPTGRAEPCPQCGELFYPQGSGQCWHCDFSS